MKLTRIINKYANTGMWLSGICILLAILLSNPYIYLLSMFFAGIPILFRAYQSLKFKTIGIECLVSIAILGACCIKEFSEAGIVAFLFQFGTYLESKTAKKTRSAIKELTEMTPTTAYRIHDEKIEEIDVDEVEEDDILLVKTGNQIAVDGIVIDGEGYVNEASITGESTLSHKTIHSNVYAGTFLENGTIKMKALRVGEDTTFSKIISLVEEAQDAKSPVERWIDSFAKYYTPCVVLISLCTFLFTRNIDTSITVLVLACPGALVIGAPIANVAGIGKAAREGILLKGGDSVYTFVKSDTFLFDKTGTLTLGKPKVVNSYEYEKNHSIEYASSLETLSDHPISNAILEYCPNHPICQHVETIKGCGLQAIVDDHEILVGNLRLMNDYHIEISKDIQNDIQYEQEKGGTLVFVSMDSILSSMLVISDTLKEDAKKSILELKKLIPHLVVLTGDHVKSAKYICEELGIQEYYGEMLPQDKLEKVKEYQNKGHITCFVGDGINDSPALITSNTGIAMGSGTDVAIDCSDVILIQSDLTSLVKALKYAKKTVKVMYQNIAIAIGTVFLLLIGLFAGYIHMSIGMLIHEASILVVIFNAMRLLKKEK